MNRVMRFRHVDGWYRGSGSIELCTSTVREYLDVGGRFDLHIGTTKPRDDDYYTLVRKGDHFVFGDDAAGSARSPWPDNADSWLIKAFPKSKRLYVWAMG